MKRTLGIYLLLITFLTLSCAVKVKMEESKKENPAVAELHQLFDDDWELTLKENPVFATMLGDKRYSDKLSVVSVVHSEELNQMNKDFLSRLESIDRSALPKNEKLNYDIYKRLTEDAVESADFKSYLRPITNRGGFHISFPQLHERVPLNNVKDYENYIARLNAFKVYAESHIEVMRVGMEGGYVLPKIVLEGAEETIEPHIVADATESLLYKPFEKYPKGIDEADQARLTEAGVDAIMNSVVPGYKLFLEFMMNEYLPASSDDIAASSLPNGKAYYEYRVRSYTTLQVTPQEVHDRGLSEVARIRIEMDEVIKDSGFEGDFKAFVEFLRTDDQFYVDTPEQLMKEVAVVLKKMDGQLPSLFGKLPRMPYGIKKVPDFIAPKTTTAYYNRPSGDGTKAGFYYVNTYDLRSRPTYEIQALSLHEAVPGHHLQIGLQQELENLPTFRLYSGFTAFTEGWALYAERLGLEAGMYEDPYSNFGRLTYEMWRALRLVVDTGMHYFGWSRQRAIDYMAENSALTLHNITTEVDRYISWPGQALAYKTGELKIRELRARAEDKLGKSFDIRAFHDVVLGSGAVPLNVLEANVDEWIASQEGM
ncbi:MAG: DUF885 domain-containing protein [Candidatus Marinimicrobia bacterium]|nr:DUF885 domain-containing protein [Candidatus Neomarinimicrobiota bacterium]